MSLLLPVFELYVLAFFCLNFCQIQIVSNGIWILWVVVVIFNNTRMKSRGENKICPEWLYISNITHISTRVAKYEALQKILLPFYLFIFMYDHHGSKSFTPLTLL